MAWKHHPQNCSSIFSPLNLESCQCQLTSCNWDWLETPPMNQCHVSSPKAPLSFFWGTSLAVLPSGVFLLHLYNMRFWACVVRGLTWIQVSKKKEPKGEISHSQWLSFWLGQANIKMTQRQTNMDTLVSPKNGYSRSHPSEFHFNRDCHEFVTSEISERSMLANQISRSLLTLFVGKQT